MKTGEKQPAMSTFESTRPAVAAMAVGIARAAYEYARDYAKEREAFGKPIIMNQAIAFMLADMATEIDASRLLVWRAAWLANNGGYVNAEGSMCKLKAGRTATWVTERAIQILGGYGYVREYPVERFHRDAKIMDIFEGTEQIQQLVISRAISRPAHRVAVRRAARCGAESCAIERKVSRTPPASGNMITAGHDPASLGVSSSSMAAARRSNTCSMLAGRAQAHKAFDVFPSRMVGRSARCRGCR